MRRRIFISQHAESGDFYNNETFEGNTDAGKEFEQDLSNIIRILFYVLLLIFITAHIWIKYTWIIFSDLPFEEIEIIFIVYDLVLVHCAIFYYIWNRKRRVEFME
ncbi:MAG: hypothetical protein WD512_14965 [Candidatus Paceibacterota bacterium]